MDHALSVFGIGLTNSLALIVAVGAQNAHVLRHGLLGRHVATVVVICIASDAMLITAGVYGLGALLIAAPRVSAALAYIGTLFLWSYGAVALVLGRLSETHADHRGVFAAGAISGSALFFSALGFGARRAAPWLARPRVWQALDGLIAVVMFWAGWHLLDAV